MKISPKQWLAMSVQERLIAVYLAAKGNRLWETNIKCK
jgi:hypothetical protein